jgi:hypothetical protein
MAGNYGLAWVPHDPNADATFLDNDLGTEDYDCIQERQSLDTGVEPST